MSAFIFRLFANQHSFPADTNGIKLALIMTDQCDIMKFVLNIVRLMLCG